jgi:hypothetical protein
MRASIWLALLVVSALGCGKDAPRAAETSPGATHASAPVAARPAMVSDQHVAAAEAMIGAMTAMNKDLAAAGKDCAKLAAVLTTHAAAVKTANTTLEEASDKDRIAVEDFSEGDAWLSATYEERRTRAFRRLEATDGLCGDDPAFKAAIEALDLALPLQEGTAEALERTFDELPDE